MPPTNGVRRESIATVPTDGGPAFCRRCSTPMGATDGFCPNCGLARLTNDTLLVQSDPVVARDVAVVDDDVVYDDGTPWLWVTLITVGALALLLAIFLATQNNDPQPTNTTTVSSLPPVVTTVPVNPAPAQAPVFIPVPGQVDNNENDQPQTVIIEREAPATTQAPPTTQAPTTTAAP